MSVRFKFRSCAVEDSLDLPHGRSSITIRDLKFQIMKKKNLKLGHDFDLVFSDALTGKVLDDENVELPSGSRVIVKRVPAWETASIRSSKLPATDKVPKFEESMPYNNANVQSMLLVKPNPQVQKNTELKSVFPSDHPAIQAADFPQELRCSLCGTFFEEAVMIPCCQCSFCEKCIHIALVEKGKCPRCLSTKSRLQDLLPNLSLRQAINSFLKGQKMAIGSRSDLSRDVPDEESRVEGICVVPTRPINIRCKPEVLEDVREFQDENQLSTVPEVQKEAYTAKTNEDNHIIASGKERYNDRPVRQKKGHRTCYMCGSPDHLIRDCPVAAQHHMYRNGSVPTYAPPTCAPPTWYMTSMPLAGSYVSMYPDYGMMPFNAPMAPVTIVGPPYAPFMCGNFSVPRAWATNQDNEIKDYYHHHESSRKHDEGKRVHENNGNQCHNFSRTEMDHKKYLVDHNHSSLNKRKPGEIEFSCRGSQHLMQTARAEDMENEFHHDPCKIAGCLDDSYGQEYRGHKSRRVL